MLEQLKKTTDKIGLAPGTIVHIGEIISEEIFIDYIHYNENEIQIEESQTLDKELIEKANFKYKWINIRGVHNLDTLKTIGEIFKINSLTLEDIANTSIYPKVEFFDDYTFIVIKDIFFNSDDQTLKYEQVSLILGENYVISFQEFKEDLFEPVRQRLIKNDVFKKKGPDYLTYALMDIIVDYLFKTLNNFGEQIEETENNLLINNDPTILQTINKMKGNIIHLRSILRPFKNLINTLEKDFSPLIKEDLKVYFRDLNDHINQLVEIVEIYRETISHLMDIYLSSANNKMSEVMKVLTIIATIFIPLTFLAGLYGMNFKYMPELDWHYGYFTVLFIMFMIFVLMLVFFRKKKWL